MALIPPSEPRDVTIISDEAKEKIKDFLQGAVYCWCKNRNNEWFSLSALVGGENKNWYGTPLQAIYDKHLENHPPEKAYEQAAQDAGRLLKSVLNKDSRSFDMKEDSWTNEYRWAS